MNGIELTNLTESPIICLGHVDDLVNASKANLLFQ
jgi:hypothetical protein